MPKSNKKPTVGAALLAAADAIHEHGRKPEPGKASLNPRGLAVPIEYDADGDPVRAEILLALTVDLVNPCSWVTPEPGCKAAVVFLPKTWIDLPMADGSTRTAFIAGFTMTLGDATTDEKLAHSAGNPQVKAARDNNSEGLL